MGLLGDQERSFRSVFTIQKHLPFHSRQNAGTWNIAQKVSNNNNNNKYNIYINQ